MTVTTLELLREVGKASWVCAMDTVVRRSSSLYCTFWGQFGLLRMECQNSLLLLLIASGLQSDLVQVT